MTDKRPTDRTPMAPLRGAIGVLVALVVSACGSDAAPTTTAPTTTSIAPTTTTVAGSVPTTTIDAMPGASLLNDALAAVGTRFSFTATVTVDDAVTTTVEGRVTDGTGEYQVAASGTVIDYIIGSDGQWARQADGDWMVLGGAAPVLDPLAPLAAPISITIVADEDGTTTLDAVYLASDLGFPDAGEVLVTLTIRNGVLAETRYIALVGNRPATVVTTFDPSGEIPDVTIPTG